MYKYVFALIFTVSGMAHADRATLDDLFTYECYSLTTDSQHPFPLITQSSVRYIASTSAKAALVEYVSTVLKSSDAVSFTGPWSNGEAIKNARCDLMGRVKSKQKFID